MIRTFYVAATLADVKKANAVADALLAEGMQQTYRWADVGAVPRAEYPSVSVKELEGVLAAEVFVGLMPGRLGMATELGAALAVVATWGGYFDFDYPRRIILWASDPEQFIKAADGLHPSIFVAHPFVERIVGDDPVKTVRDYLFGTGVERRVDYP